MSTPTDHVTIVRDRVPAYAIQVPTRADELVLGDRVVVDDADGQSSFAIAHLLVDGRARTVRAEPFNRDYPSRLEVGARDWVTVLLNPDQVPTPRGHGQRITAHDPKKHGWYTKPGGWDVACACGWTADEVVPGGKGAALDVWDVHKATVINELLALDRNGWPAAHLVVADPTRRHLGRSMQRYRLVRRK
ncbi:hypothetical protein [Saccharothrix sp. HUAS TT1]|uniref:hypothetical protein n=1 Tax=unclassified Saccharothrix TaxID=2593673 RepID=UPI00345BFB41